MSKRLNLREFQQNLIDRLQAKDMSEERVSTLGVQIAGRNWLVDLADIGEVLPLPKLISVPFTKPWFRGVANVRGNLYAVPIWQPISTAGQHQEISIIASCWLLNGMPLTRRFWLIVYWVCVTRGNGGKAGLKSKSSITMSRARPGQIGCAGLVGAGGIFADWCLVFPEGEE